MSPPFIVFEGLDGSGKSTLARMVAERLGAACLTTPPAALRPYRESLDAIFARASVSATLFYAASVAVVSDEVRAFRASGRTVVVDRYWLSTRAYARVLGRDLVLPEVERLLEPATLTVLVEASHEVRCQRLRARGGVLAHDRATFARPCAEALAAAYDELLGASPITGRVLRLDATHASPEALAARVADAIESFEARAA